MTLVRCPSCSARASIRGIGRCPICGVPMVRPAGAAAIALVLGGALVAGLVFVLRPAARSGPPHAELDEAPPATAESEPRGSGEAGAAASAGATPPERTGDAGRPDDAQARADAAAASCATLDRGPGWDAVCACLAERARTLPPLSPTEDGVGMASPPRLRERPYVRALAECALPFHQVRAHELCRARCRDMGAPCSRICACVASTELTETGFTAAGDKHLLARGEPQALYRRMMTCEDELRRGMRYAEGEYIVVPGIGQARLDRIRVVDSQFRGPDEGARR